jgi:hypothetical protein
MKMPDFFLGAQANNILKVYDEFIVDKNKIDVIRKIEGNIVLTIE